MSVFLHRAGLLQVVEDDAGGGDTYSGTITVGTSGSTDGYRQGSYGSISPATWGSETIERFYALEQSGGTRTLLLVRLSGNVQYNGASSINVTVGPHGPFNLPWQSSQYHDGYQIDHHVATEYMEANPTVDVTIEPVY